MPDLPQLLSRRKQFLITRELFQRLFDVPEDVYVSRIFAAPSGTAIAVEMVSERFERIQDGAEAPCIDASVNAKRLDDDGTYQPYVRIEIDLPLDMPSQEPTDA